MMSSRSDSSKGFKLRKCSSRVCIGNANKTQRWWKMYMKCPEYLDKSRETGSKIRGCLGLGEGVEEGMDSDS